MFISCGANAKANRLALKQLFCSPQKVGLKLNSLILNINVLKDNLFNCLSFRQQASFFFLY